MKFIKAIFFILIFAIVICGCSNQNMNSQGQSCSHTCEHMDFWENTLEEGFELSAEEYKVICSECTLGRASYIKALIEKDGEPLELFFKWGWCSSGGSDCGSYEVFTSFSEKTDPVYQKVKNKLCSDVCYTGNYANVDLCKGVPYNEKERVEQECLAGAFEKIEGNKKTIAIDGINNRCSCESKKGNFDIWGWKKNY